MGASAAPPHAPQLPSQLPPTPAPRRQCIVLQQAARREAQAARLIWGQGKSCRAGPGGGARSFWVHLVHASPVAAPPVLPDEHPLTQLGSSRAYPLVAWGRIGRRLRLRVPRRPCMIPHRRRRPTPHVGPSAACSALALCCSLSALGPQMHAAGMEGVAVRPGSRQVTLACCCIVEAPTPVVPPNAAPPGLLPLLASVPSRWWTLLWLAADVVRHECRCLHASGAGGSGWPGRRRPPAGPRAPGWLNWPAQPSALAPGLHPSIPASQLLGSRMLVARLHQVAHSWHQQGP